MPQVSAGPSASTAPSASVRSLHKEPAKPRKPALTELGFTVTTTHKMPRFAWRLINGFNWQPVAVGTPLPEPWPPAPTKLGVDRSTPCPADMVLVEGDLVLDAQSRAHSDHVLRLQNRACSHWRTADHGIGGLCDQFDPAGIREHLVGLPRSPMRYCIDRFEFPNAHGEFPLVATIFSESVSYCEAVGKRLCGETEWTFACEGPEARPFPQGWSKAGQACNVDVLAPGAGGDAFKPRNMERTARAIDASFQGRRSGASPSCASVFGVHDMTGNVDEWTSSDRRGGYRSILKGGHWGPARHRCRPQTRGHGPLYLRHDQGFRCCADVAGARSENPVAGPPD